MAMLIEEIDKFASAGITADELAGAKKGILEGFTRNLSNDQAVIGILHDGLYLDRTTAYWSKRNKAVETATLAQVNEAIKKRYKPGSLVKITAGDQKKM
jgi:zinc protease